jgi:aspartate carbamoyltransferase catalytic subunit
MLIYVAGANQRMDVNYFPSTREYAQQYGVDKTLLDSLNKEIVIISGTYKQR